MPEWTVSDFDAMVAKHEADGYIVKTINNAGWQMNLLDTYGKIFVQYAATCKRPVLDLAVAFGFTTKKLLESGANVVANDLSSEMLDELRNSLQGETLKRIQFYPGNALDLSFPEGSFDGIWANRFFHYLHPNDLRSLIEKCFGWLAPKGKLCITTASEFLGQCDKTVYKKNLEDGVEWPGLFEVPESQRGQWVDIVPFFHCISVRQLVNEVKRVGFIVERSGYLDWKFFGIDGKECSAIIAVKP